jgi:hypothetical protein
MTDTTTKPERDAVRIPEDVRRHFHTARREVQAGIRALLPPDVVQHGRRARRELLLAWRGVIDAALETLSEADKNAK